MKKLRTASVVSEFLEYLVDYKIFSSSCTSKNKLLCIEKIKVHETFYIYFSKMSLTRNV